MAGDGKVDEVEIFSAQWREHTVSRVHTNHGSVFLIYAVNSSHSVEMQTGKLIHTNLYTRKELEMA